jgi:hypothetical protein
MTKSHISVENDYSQIQPFIDARQERIENKNRSLRAEQFGIYAKWVSIGLVAFGIMVLFIFWGISLLTEKPQPKVITTEKVVEKPSVIRVEVPVASSSPPQQTIKDTVERIESSNNSSDAQIVTNYTIFQSVSFGRPGYLNVVTGLRYSKSTSPFPEHQYCYLEKVDPRGQLRIDLADADSDGNVSNQRFNPASNVSRSNFREARSKCRFVSK